MALSSEYTDQQLIDMKQNRGLTYAQLAQLLGIKSGSQVAKYFRDVLNIHYKSRGTKANTNPHIEVVQHYIPDYRREISPIQKEVVYQYGGIEFTIDLKDKLATFQFGDVLKNNVVDVQDLEELIQFGEALVGIGLFVRSQLK